MTHLHWMAQQRLFSDEPRWCGSKEAKTFEAAVRFPKEHTQWYSQGCTRHRRQMGCSLALLMTTTCSASCAFTKKN